MNTSKSNHSFNFKFILMAHLVLALSGPIAFSFVSGCGETLEEGVAELENPVSEKAVLESVDKALEGMNPLHYTAKEAVLYEYNYKIEVGSAMKLLDIQLHVLERHEDNKALTVRLGVLGKDYSQDPPTDLPVAEDNQVYNKVSSTDTSISLSPRVASLRFDTKTQSSSMVINSVSTSAIDKVTYHNLKVETVKVPAPAAVAERENCSGLDPCQMEATKISFEIALWTGDKYDKQIKEYLFSKQMPFFSYYFRHNATDYLISPGVLYECTNYFEPINGKKYYVRLCKVARDFILQP